MTCYNEKGFTNPIYHVKLLDWVIYYAKVDFSTENVFLDFATLRSIFGET